MMVETIVMVVVCGFLLLGVVVLVWALFAADYEELPPAPSIFGDDDDPEHE